MPEPTNAPPSKRFTMTSPIALCTIGLTAALVTVAYLRRSSTIKHGHGWSHLLLSRDNDMLLKPGGQKQLPESGSARFYACRNLYKLGLTERIPDYPHPAGTQTDLRIKMALWPGISSYEPHYISTLRCDPYAQINPGRLALFCHNDKEQPVYPPRYYTYNNDWVTFNAWIPEYLQVITKTLRTKMMKEPSAPDKPGHIYAFEIKDPRTSRKIHIKVGRASSLDALDVRLGSWRRHYKSTVIRHIYPREGMTTDREEVPTHMFLESLIHIELGDPGTMYYYANFPNGKAPLLGVQIPKSRCIAPDCRIIHREVFSFERCVVDGTDIDEIIVEIIQHWSKFCKTFYSSPPLSPKSRVPMELVPYINPTACSSSSTPTY